jgi:hypothetical protein
MKTCSNKNCNQLNPQSETNFLSDRRNQSGLQSQCKYCKAAQQKNRRDNLRKAFNEGFVEAKRTEKNCINPRCTQSNPQPMINFYRDYGMSDGHRNTCKYCKNATTGKWRELNREHYIAKMRSYNHKNYQKMRFQKYKLTPADFSKMLYEQKGVCAICGGPPRGKWGLFVDHDHKTGRVRGLLCHGCNRAIAILDNPKTRDKAIEYTKK